MSIGWGIVGCGTIADNRIAPAVAASDNAKLVAFCSRSLERAAEFADRHGADRGYDKLADLIDDPEVQAVYVATPNANHPVESIALLEGGKHVLCDKPLATSAEDADRMVQTARRCKRLLGVACQMRYLPGMVQLKELIDGGEFGQVLFLRAGFGFIAPPDGRWRKEPALAGGGPIMDLGPHTIDTMRWLAGEIVAVTARVGNVRFDYEVEDLASAILEFESGAVGLMDVGYSYSDASLSLFGTEGSARMARAFGQVFDWDLTVTIGGETTATDGHADRAYIDEIEDFSSAVEQGAASAPVSGVDGLRAQEVIEAILESAEAAERVELEG